MSIVEWEKNPESEAPEDDSPLEKDSQFDRAPDFDYDGEDRHERNVIASGHEGACTPYVVEMLQGFHKKASEFTIRPSTNRTFEATIGGCAHRVSLEQRTCSCRKWEITGIPCEHAYGVMLKRGLQAEDYVCHWFRTPTWRRTYEEGINPIRGAKFWPVGAEPPIIEPEIPEQEKKKKVTKKDKKRKRGINESPTKKSEKVLKRVMHCGVCGQANHNSSFHKKKKSAKAALEGATSEAVSTQGEATQGCLTQETN